jgi:hypothetical protein
MIAVYRVVFVDDCPIWSGETVSSASSLATFAFNIEIQVFLTFDRIAGDDGRDSQVVLGCCVR